MNKSIAFFDFDGTITRKDTLLEFIRFSKGDFNFLKGLLICSPFLIAYKIKIISNQSAKEKFLAHFFKNTPIAKFDFYSEAFIKEKLPALIRRDAIKEIERLQKEGFQVIIVSASPENWVGAWAERVQLEHLCTKLEIKNNKITGKIEGKNCFGIEKVNRIKIKYNLKEFSLIHVYGDSSGDLEMLQIADQAFFRPFRKVL